MQTPSSVFSCERKVCRMWCSGCRRSWESDRPVIRVPISSPATSARACDGLAHTGCMEAAGLIAAGQHREMFLQIRAPRLSIIRDGGGGGGGGEGVEGRVTRQRQAGERRWWRESVCVTECVCQSEYVVQIRSG